MGRKTASSYNVGGAGNTAGKRRGRTRDIVYMPTRQRHTGRAVLVGALCRAILSALFVFGLTLFISDAFGIYPDKAGASPMFWCALFCAVTIALICRGGRYAAAGVVAILGGMTAYAATVSVDIVRLAVQAAAAIHNTVVDRFVYVGLTAVHDMTAAVSPSELFKEGEVYKCGVMMLTLLLSVLFVPAICRRCRPVYITLLSAVFIVPSCAYNMMTSNWGFAVFVSAAAGVVVLALHDRGYTVPTKKKRLVFGDGAVNIDTDTADTSRAADTSDADSGAAREKADDITLMLEDKAARRRRIRAEREARKTEKRAAKAEKKRAAEIRRANERPDRSSVRDSASLGGIAGLVTALFALLIVALPAHYVETAQPEIPFLTGIMQTARTYFTAFIESDEVDLNRVPSEGFITDDGGARVTETKWPKYENIVLATVETPTSMPVYLRSWIGTRYEDEKWYSASLREADAFREAFGDEFSPEMIKETFYRAMFPGFDDLPGEYPALDMAEYGFVTERVSVTRKSGKSTLLYLPSFVLPSRGLLSYNTDTASLLPHTVYFDGIWTSRLFVEGTSYSTDSLVTTMKYPGLGKKFGDSIREYLLSLDIIASEQADEIIGAGDDVVMPYIEMYEKMFSERYGIYAYGTSLLRRYILDMTDEERAALKEAAEIQKKYKEYVDATYLQTDESDVNEIRSVAQSVLRQNGLSSAVGSNGFENYHDVVMALVKYLDANFIYSKEKPEASETPDDTPDSAETDVPAGEPETDAETDAVADSGQTEPTAVVEFLTKTRRGYCVQFASALTLMLRSVGIPARYCEGFIVSNFRVDAEADAGLKYKSDVLDSDAHAWVEVYYDGMGWVQYEATPPYGEAMYGSALGGGGGGGVEMPDPPDDKPENPNKPQKPAETEAADTSAETGDTAEPGSGDRAENAMLTASIVSIAVSLVAFAVYAAYVKIRSDKAVLERATLIKKCRDEGHILSDGERRELAHRVAVGIFDVYRELGMGPEAGELSEEYASRLSGAVGAASEIPVADVMVHIGSEEFGHSIDAHGLSELARYYGELTSNVYGGLSFKDKFVLRYIKRVL